MPMNGPRNDLTMNWSSFFMCNLLCCSQLDKSCEGVSQAINILATGCCKSRLSATAAKN